MTKDMTIIDLLTVIGIIPLVLSLIWIATYIEILNMPIMPIVALLLSCIFGILLYHYEPHLKHWRKAQNEFEKTYSYDECDTK